MLEHLGSLFALVCCGGDHHMNASSRCHVIAAAVKLACFACAMREAGAVYHTEVDAICRARLTVANFVASPARDFHKRLDGACFCNLLLHVLGGGELNHVRCLPFRVVLLTGESIYLGKCFVNINLFCNKHFS